MLADQNKSDPADQLGLTPDTGKPVQARPAVGISEEPPQSVEPVAAKPAHNGQVQTKILQKFATISGYTRSLTNLVLCIKKDAHQVLLMLRIWWNVLRQSQELFPVKICRQMLLTKVRGVLGTKNRMSPGQIVKYHKTPTSILPAVNPEDRLIIEMLFLEAHVTPNGTHLEENLTMLRMCSGFYGVHVANMGKAVKRLIEACVSCKARKGKLEQTDNGDKFG